MKLKQLVLDTALLAELSGIIVEVNRSQEWVKITDDSGSEVFLQGHEASDLVDKFDGLFNNPELEDVEQDKLWLYLAYDYSDILE
jgi:hypothetical protein